MENVVRKALAAILALVLAAVFAGCGNKNLLGRDRRMKAITGYSEEELGLLDAYLEHSAGAEISLYKTEYNQDWPISGPEAFTDRFDPTGVCKGARALRVTDQDLECQPKVVLFSAEP